MKLPEFRHRIEKHNKLEWAGCRECAEGDRVLVQNGKLMSIPVSEVLARDWRNLEAVMLGRDPWVLERMTRVVGYFSQVRNWNKGRLAELRDRHKGTYVVPEVG